MARRGEIEIPIAVDTGGFEKGIRNGLIDPIDDAEQALKELGKSDPGRELERDIKKAEDALDDLAATDAGRDLERDMSRAQDATEDLDDELDRTRKSLDKLGYAARDAGDDGSDGMGKIKSGAGELSNEIGSNLGEAVSSFRGDMTDLGQVGQDTLGGLAATLSGAGPAGIVGAVALAAGAIGVGGLVGSIEEADEAAKELKKRAGEIAAAWIDAGEQIIDAQSINSAISSIVGDDEQMKKADELVDKLGIKLPDAIRILAGDQNALNSIEDEYRQKLQDRAELEAMIDDNRGKASGKTRDQRKELREWIETYEKEAGVFSEASDLFVAGSQAQSDALLDYIRDAKEAQLQTDKYGNKLVELPDGKKIVIDADTGRATLNLDEFRGDMDKLPKTKTSTVKFTVDDRDVRNYRAPVKPGVVVYQAQGNVRQRG